LGGWRGEGHGIGWEKEKVTKLTELSLYFTKNRDDK
jgi:hypothetical protein